MATIEQEHRLVVSDAGPLIHLDELGCLDVLDYAEVCIPDAVWEEVSHHRPGALLPNDPRWRRFPAGPLPARIAAIIPLFGLQRGESAALAICCSAGSGLLLSDDAAARHAADSLGVPTRGTIGLLIRAARRGLRTQRDVLRLLSGIPSASTLHIRPSLLERIVRGVEREWKL